jgi:hypothetical protein
MALPDPAEVPVDGPDVDSERLGHRAIGRRRVREEEREDGPQLTWRELEAEP